MKKLLRSNKRRLRYVAVLFVPLSPQSLDIPQARLIWQIFLPISFFIACATILVSLHGRSEIEWCFQMVIFARFSMLLWHMRVMSVKGASLILKKTYENLAAYFKGI